MYLDFNSPYILTAGANHHWRGLIMKKSGQPIDIARPITLSGNPVILCNLTQSQIVAGTNFYFDAYTIANSTSTSHDTLVLMLTPVLNTIAFSA